MDRVCEMAFDDEILAQARRTIAESAALLAVIKRNNFETIGSGAHVCQCSVCREHFSDAAQRYEERFEFGVGI